jgi:hypothetical protein
VQEKGAGVNEEGWALACKAVWEVGLMDSRVWHLACSHAYVQVFGQSFRVPTVAVVPGMCLRPCLCVPVSARTC